MGKTTLVESFLELIDLRYRYDSGDDALVREVLESQSLNIVCF